MPLGKRGNFSVTQFPGSEDETNTSEFVESSKNGMNDDTIVLVIILLNDTYH